MFRPRVAIVGVGNILMGDDGVGVRVVERLQQRSLPEGVEVVDAGTAFQDVLPRLAEHDLVIVVDAVRAGGSPGQVYCFDLGPDNIASSEPCLSVHDVNVVAAARLQMISGVPLPPIRVLGVEPKDAAMNLQLSDEVCKRLEEVADLAIKEAQASGQACVKTGGTV